LSRVTDDEQINSSRLIELHRRRQRRRKHRNKLRKRSRKRAYNVNALVSGTGSSVANVTTHRLTRAASTTSTTSTTATTATTTTTTTATMLHSTSEKQKAPLGDSIVANKRRRRRSTRVAAQRSITNDNDTDDDDNDVDDKVGNNNTISTIQDTSNIDTNHDRPGKKNNNTNEQNQILSNANNNCNNNNIDRNKNGSYNDNNNSDDDNDNDEDEDDDNDDDSSYDKDINNNDDCGSDNSHNNRRFNCDTRAECLKLLCALVQRDPKLLSLVRTRALNAAIRLLGTPSNRTSLQEFVQPVRVAVVSLLDVLQCSLPPGARLLDGPSPTLTMIALYADALLRALEVG